MKAVRMIAVNQPLQMYEIPIPEIGERDILVRVRAAGICHSDAHYRAGRSPVRPLPMTLGQSRRSSRASRHAGYPRQSRRPGVPAL